MDPMTMTASLAGAGAGLEVVDKTQRIMATAIKNLYGAARSLEDYLDDHIEKMKLSDDTTVSRTGRVLENAKVGFGVGMLPPLIVIAGGQLLLGNPLSAVGAILSAPFNPIVMTCAAVGAVYYGWGALSEQERAELLEKVSEGLNVGVEFVKSVILFVREKIKLILSKENVEEFKKYINSVAASFGRSLADVTRKAIDKVKDAFDVLVEKAGAAIEKTAGAASGAYDKLKKTAEPSGEVAGKTTSSHATEAEKHATTCGRNIGFSYIGSVTGGVRVVLAKSSFAVSEDFFKMMIETFAGRTVMGGFSTTNPIPEGFGEWVRDQSQEYNCQTLSPRHASFIAGILRNEGKLRSERVNNSIRLVFEPIR
ncbi:hypothetical protein L4X63_12255 [Geomonas sp. Red32]|uniref:hypothetical protein n=1 Tax=Geomonas sp. Red32 TaxID=2912856 RepID=UPI00202CC023|nr:hypothetical protein [Geomonas sp. Red32]MCM0082361.1 hypothetical protein [Geomonas sp. Red32]